MFSPSGMIPCELCPRNTFAGPPTLGGYTECRACSPGTYTENVGATGPTHCKEPCRPGEFSMTGLQPCSKCPPNFFQPAVGQQRCIECPLETQEFQSGANISSECRPVDCSLVQCQNGGECEVANHLSRCRCRPGFSGALCEQNLDSCLSQPCYHGATCVDQDHGFTCVCPQSKIFFSKLFRSRFFIILFSITDYTGERCEFGPNDCVGIQCPNGGVCQDLPGSGTTKCLCRTGYTGLE